MPDLLSLAHSQPIAWAVLVLSLVAVSGLALGSLKVRGIGLGTAGVLFSGILCGHFGWRIEPAVLHFVKEFGLILFVFTIGLQLGPGFFAAFRRNGLPLNALAASIVLLGAAGTWIAARLFGIDPFAAVGLFSGATTNTPSLGAAEQVIGAMAGVDPARSALPALAYAVSYPAGIAGIIASLLLLRVLFRISPESEAARFAATHRPKAPPLSRLNIVVENPNLDGLRLADIPGRRETGAIVSRISRAGTGTAEAADEDRVLRTGDILLAVGTPESLENFRRIVGRVSDVDLLNASGPVMFRRVLVTHAEILGRTVGELALNDRFEVTVTRVTRADIEMGAVPDLRLQFGDQLMVVGEAANLDRAAAVLGNSLKELNSTHFIPVFTGIALGVIVGLVPVAIPGLPAPVRLGLAGGPLIIAILLARIGNIGRLVWHMPATANLAFRELGITLFLAAVGLGAGEHFFATVFTPAGLAWLGTAVLIAMVPLLLVGWIARKRLGLDFMSLSGLLSGAMTDPPALAFACAIARDDSPSVAYATVYPATMLLRILTAQLLALYLAA
jgi:putative transport protein